MSRSSDITREKLISKNTAAAAAVAVSDGVVENVLDRVVVVVCDVPDVAEEEGQVKSDSQHRQGFFVEGNVRSEHNDNREILVEEDTEGPDDEQP